MSFNGLEKMKKIDNPAERLHRILDEGRKIRNDIKCRDAWFDILKISPKTEINLMRGIANTAELADKIIFTRDELLNSSRAKSTHWYNCFNDALTNQNLNGQWSTFKNHIDNTTISELDMLTMIFETSGSETPLDDEKLAEFKMQIIELREEIIHSSLEKGVQFALLALLKKALEAIELYQITGAGPIMEAVEASVGRIMFDHNLQEEVKTGVIGKQFSELLGGLANFITVAQGVKELAGPIAALLLGKV